MCEGETMKYKHKLIIWGCGFSIIICCCKIMQFGEQDNLAGVFAYMFMTLFFLFLIAMYIMDEDIRKE